MDFVDEKIKEVKQDQGRTLCRTCGRGLGKMAESDDNEWSADLAGGLCVNCLRIATQIQFGKPGLVVFVNDPVCQWCKNFPKISHHAWCESCRDKHQASVITALMRNGEWDKGGDFVERIKRSWPVYKKLYENKGE